MLFHTGLKYSAINTARSALSAVLQLPLNATFGTHPLVVRFLRGVFQCRPALPKYVETWDVDKVLRCLKTLSPVKHLTLKNLTLKLVTLIAILSGQRLQTIHLLKLNNMIVGKSSYKFVIDSMLKTTRVGVHNSELELTEHF